MCIKPNVFLKNFKDVEDVVWGEVQGDTDTCKFEIQSRTAEIAKVKSHTRNVSAAV